MTATEGEATATGDSPKAHYGKINDPRLSAEEMDERRKENLAYEYLCHLEEAKIWIEACIHEELAPTTELEESLRNGVALGKLAHFMAPDVVPIKRVYDRDQARFKARGLHFRHTDNINHWLHAMADIGHPKIFYPETTDIYDRKNMPRVIYCIHALSLYLFKLGKAPQIQDLYGKVKFTDEEINAMRQELEKYGIQMPAFSKIGGILANEMPVDEAALHAAVIAINEAIDQQNAADTLKALRLPAAHLVNVNDEPYQLYQTHLYQAKHTKAENARNKSLDPDSSYVPDVYDELLTQAELQGNINAVNVECVLRAIDDALVAHTLSALEEGLKSSVLQLRNVNHENMEVYMTALCDVKSHKDNNNLLTRDELQLCINRANTEADAHVQKRAALEQINEAVRSGDSEKIVKALCNPAAQLPSIHDDAAALYSHEFINIRAEKQEDLEYDEISGGVQVLSAIAEINRAVDMGDSSQTVSALNHEEAHIEAVDPTLHDKYLKQLKTAKASKRQSSCELLTHHEIQESITSINSQVNDEHQRILAVEAINEAVDAGDAAKTLQALQAPGAKLQDVETANNGSTYQRFLYIRKKKKQQDQNDNSAVLWYEEIQDTVIQSNALQQQGLMLSEAMTQLNTALHASQEPKVCACLVDPALYLHTVPACMGEYYTQLRLLLESKQHAGECGGGWMMNRLKEGHKFYYNTQTKEFAWERPAHVRKDHSLLTREEVQTCVSIVTKQHERDELFASNEGVVVRLQAAVRGNIVRKRLSSRLSFINSQLPAILKIQTWWRMARAKKRYKERKHYLYQQNNAVLVLQSAMRMYLIRKNYLNRMQYLRSHEAAAIKIQAFMRKNWAQQDYKHLMHGENPPLSVVRRFVHLLDQSDVDYSEEVELEKLRREVVTDIRNNQKLDSDLNEMDIKIGLLVKNRLTLQDVISQHKTLKRYRENSSSSLTASSSCHRGLKALSKASRERLEAYQHLFYLLQTNPTYLARLIFEMPQSKTTKFMESVILTLYNYASNQREEYLLLKLFKTALEEEIRRMFGKSSTTSVSQSCSKVDKLSDIVTGNPLVIKMIVSFNRNARGQSQLRELLHPLVSDVINDRGLVINTNPVEVYKQWINHMETVSGKPSGLAYDVTLSEALEHQEVQDRINHSLTKLKDATDRFLNAILDSIEKIPYGMRYMAKVLYESLKSQFPEALEKDLLKIVGNLIYYRYINSAIVAPDAFDIVDIGANKSLTNDQRRNLGSIAKILQFAASNKGFGGDSEHLACLNPYIMEAHNKFKKYFRKICDVEDPEVHFNMDQYTDVTRVTKPIIYISIAEIIETHKLLLDHQDHVAPDHSDPLHELLEDLGDSPEVDSLLGDDYISDDNVNKQQMSKTEISLTLSNKFEVPENDDTDMKSLLIRTKRMIVDVIRCQHGGDSLPKVLTTRASEHEENEHAMLIKRRERVDKRAASRKAKLVRHQSMLGDTRLPLETMKKHIERNLEQLERVHMVTSADNYQSLINSIVQDVRNQRYYRQRRKQEMMRLKTTLKSLATKKSFYNEQIEYYNQYVKTCLDNLSTRSRNKSKRSSLFSRDTDSKGIKTIKYSASKLHEKGIILEIEGLPNAQFKNMLFEIQSTEIAGKFEINTKFMGVHMDRVEVVFEDLLRMQYEGVAVMKMFDKAKINVNLLIFMLNKKFYGK